MSFFAKCGIHTQKLKNHAKREFDDTMARNNTAILEEECYREQLASCCECEMRMKAVTKKTRSNVIVLGPTQSTAVTPILTLLSLVVHREIYISISLKFVESLNLTATSWVWGPQIIYKVISPWFWSFVNTPIRTFSDFLCRMVDILSVRFPPVGISACFQIPNKLL